MMQCGKITVIDVSGQQAIWRKIYYIAYRHYIAYKQNTLPSEFNRRENIKENFFTGV